MDFVDFLTRGNLSQIKTVLASIVTALALYQVALMAVGYGKVGIQFLSAKAASFAHRASGDSIVLITLLIAFMCLSYFQVEDGIEYARGGETTRATIHVFAGFALLGVLALKVVVVRWWHSMGRYLPLVGVTVFTLFIVTWASSAANFLWSR